MTLQGGKTCVFQSDGNVVVYISNGISGTYYDAWSSQSYPMKSNQRMVVQSDGNVVIYSGTNEVRWASGTAGK